MGLLALTIGEVDQAVAHFENSLELCRKASYRPELAWTCHDYADLLLNSSLRLGPRLEDRINVKSLLNEAMAISSELGMRPLTKRVAALQEAAAAKLGPAPIYPSGLTEREVEVLRLIASGSSNREIGAELVLSTRTVERHITNIYGKINARGRADATSYVLRHQLLLEQVNTPL